MIPVADHPVEDTAVVVDPVRTRSQRIVLMLAHSIEEYDQLRLLDGLGYEVFSIGAYSDPRHPEDHKRPPLGDLGYYARLHDACRRSRERHPDGADWAIDWAKADLDEEILGWADTIIVHHFTDRWLIPQWDRLRDWGGRVIWRTTGQSNPDLERATRPLVEQGLEIVRYSPRERAMPYFAGEDAVIRFYKDPDEWDGWTGETEVVGNVTQDLMRRGNATGYWFWEQATSGLPRSPAGPGSAEIGGVGELTPDRLQRYLRSIRCYLYTGTVPASYTLGLIEAAMTGVPIVSIGPHAWGWWSPLFGYELFEAPDLIHPAGGYEDPTRARAALQVLLEDRDAAKAISVRTRLKAIQFFGRDYVGAAWREYLG